MNSHHKPAGHVAGPLMVLGSVSLVLGFAGEFLGLFAGAEDSLRSVWERVELIFRGELGVSSPVGILLGAALSYGLVGAILGTPGAGRQMVLGVSAFALGIALMPVLAVWGIFWKPFGLSLMTGWAWFSAMMYANRHRMPCEGPVEAEAKNVISLDDGLSKEAKQGRANG